MQKITPFLWYDNKAEEAAKFYVSVFPKSKITTITHYTKESAEMSGMKKGSIMTVEFELNGQTFTAINGGPVFKFTEAVSFVVACKNQKEIDHYWDKLTADGGEESQCGWLKDKYGLSWQITPEGWGDLIKNDKTGKYMAEMMKMTKLDIAKLKAAAKSK